MTELTQEAEYIILYLMRKEIAERESAYKAKYTDGVKAADGKLSVNPMRPNERRPVFIELDDGTEIELGGITRTQPSSSWKVTRPSELDKWIRANHPEALETVTVVSDRYVADLLAAAKRAGAAVTGEGEEIPGVEEVTGTSYVAPKPVSDAYERVRELVSVGAIQWGQVLPQIGAGS